MRDPGHGASRIHQRPVWQRWSALKAARRWTSHLLQTSLAVAGQITNERLEVNNSFCVHLDDVLDFPKGTRRGMWGPRQPRENSGLAGGCALTLSENALCMALWRRVPPMNVCNSKTQTKT